MKFAIVFPKEDELLSKVASQVQQGVVQAGGEVELLPVANAPPLMGYEVVFLGISAHGLSKRMDAVSLAASTQPSPTGVRIFCVHSGAGKQALEQAVALLSSKSIAVQATLLLESKGLLRQFGKGTLGEGDLARAKAFGERGASSVLGRQARPENEKQRIKGYRK